MKIKNKMKNYLYLILILICSCQITAQNPGDTIVVQTFDYSSNTRDTIAYFPDNTNLSFEKIILSYNMRCKDNIINTNGSVNNVGCGAWDYSCHTYIHDSTRIDSILSNQASHVISNFSGSSYDYSINPVYNYFQYIHPAITLDSIITENLTHIGYGNDSLDVVLATENNSFKSHFLYTADELTAMGLLHDTIKAISINVLNGNQTANFLKIRLKLTNDSLLNNISPHLTGFTEVYNSNTILYNGLNKFYFTNDFLWDSISNIIVEFSFTNSTVSNASLVSADTTTNISGLITNDANHITLNSAENIDFPITASMTSNVSDEITITFWANGNANVLPQNTSILEGLDTNGYRTLNIHFPWSNSRIYWDCGNDGTSSYDRIDKAANINEYTNEWSHWAFTKNTNTGVMNIYRNGVIWHSGSGKSQQINLSSLKLGSNGNGNSNFWNGHIKDLQIFNKELSDTTINNWINIRFNSTHPNATNLIAYYPFSEGQGNTVYDYSVNSQMAQSNGNINWGYSRGDQLFKFFSEISARPDIVLYQGEYEMSIVNDTILDSLIAIPNTINEYAIFPNHNTLQNDSIAIISTNNYWEAISNIYDEQGNIISSNTTSIDGNINITSLAYYNRYPMAFQIMSFVTPYGAYLDLGENGKTWYFDLTDFSPILKGQKRINMSGGGQWQEDMDIKFLFIVGTPPRDVLDAQQIWRPQSKGYANIMANESFEPKNILFNSDANSYKLRTVITGHGQEGEFISRNHFLNIDGGPQEFVWPVWTECAGNPIFPQGGTWIYDRAGWCPGQASDIREDDISSYVSPGQIHNIDYGVVSASGNSNYWVSSQLISYDQPNHSLDAAVIDILSPTNEILHFRKNPICSKPKIIIQNTGITTLTSLTINYWINNENNSSTYQWNGNLNFLEKEEIELPASIAFWSSIDLSEGLTLGEVTTYDHASDVNKFHVSITTANGSEDEYTNNNTLSSSFTPPPQYPNVFTFWYQTNNGVIGSISETSWELNDNLGNMIYNGNNLMPNTQYKDTISLSNGCYVLDIYDVDHDGIDFWANNDGSGMLRFRRLQPYVDTTATPWTYHNWFKTFEGDFGSYLHHEFIVAENPLSINEPPKSKFDVYPNPTSKKLNLDGNLISNGEIVILNTMGELLYQKQLLPGEINMTLNMKNYPNGIYMIKIKDNYGELVKKIVKH
jgi:hypothetical protein